jgi:hypothetical protein
MPTITKVKLDGRIINANQAELTISWATNFKQPEVLSRSIFVYDIYIKNIDGIGDLDVRHRRLGTAWDLAADNPIEREVKYKVSRNYLNEDFLFLGGGDTTDEGIAEVTARPFTPKEYTAKSSVLRMEFGP